MEVEAAGAVASGVRYLPRRTGVRTKQQESGSMVLESNFVGITHDFLCISNDFLVASKQSLVTTVGDVLPCHAAGDVLMFSVVVVTAGVTTGRGVVTAWVTTGWVVGRPQSCGRVYLVDGSCRW